MKENSSINGCVHEEESRIGEKKKPFLRNFCSKAAAPSAPFRKTEEDIIKLRFFFFNNQNEISEEEKNLNFIQDKKPLLRADDDTPKEGERKFWPLCFLHLLLFLLLLLFNLQLCDVLIDWIASRD